MHYSLLISWPFTSNSRKFNLITINLLYHYSLLFIIPSSVNITNITFNLMLVLLLTLISFSPNFKLPFKICYEQHNINLIKFIILIYSGSAQFFFIDKPFIFLIFNICWIFINFGAQSIVCNSFVFMYVFVCNLLCREGHQAPFHE